MEERLTLALQGFNSICFLISTAAVDPVIIVIGGSALFEPIE
jgi:hypothetical protein